VSITLGKPDSGAQPVDLSTTSPVVAQAKRGLSPLRIIAYVLLAVAFVVFALPIYWLISTALKRADEVYQFPIQWFPTSLHFQNFLDAWNAVPFGRFYLNSLITTGFGTLLEMTLAILSAYAFAFVDFRYKQPVLIFVLGSMMLPGHVTLLVNYITAGNLGWINTYQGLILPGIASAFAMFLLLQHMRRISGELVDAMTIDGAGHFYRLTHLVLPLSRPMIITSGLIVLIAKWNEFIWPLIITNTESMRTLPIGLVSLRQQEASGNTWGALMAGTVLVALPMMIIFFVGQKRIIGGLASGALR
jgi:multiple sugar transport system permease protein/sn-glycerol 3-phosphate transport system permease protein